LEWLRAGQSLLDVGCGPGTITADLAERVAPGRVIGVDRVEDVIAQARTERVDARSTAPLYSVGDAYALPFVHAAFDVVHAHQLLQHLTQPVSALCEMRRVLKPGGLLAVRESDYGCKAWAPDDMRLRRWLELYHQVTAHNGAQADAGRYLLGWVQAAGFTDAKASSSTWTFADDDSRRWWGGLWADRVRYSAFARQAVAYGLSDDVELAGIAEAFLQWRSQPDGVFIVVHGEVVARRPGVGRSPEQQGSPSLRT
jgi:SAM-dependent methyltransferase